jgi:hypothetical protein
MSRNGSYAKSMNGIVSFDDGDGTVIEGSEITTDTINCKSLNATSTVKSPFVYSNFIYSYSGGQLGLKNDTLISGSLTTTNGIQIANLEGRGTGGAGSLLNIGQSNDYTSAVYIGRDSFTAGGFTFPAIPVRTTYIPTSNYDICNKLYVDNATAGANILSLSNTFTGATNTFQNLNTTGNIVATGNVTGEIIKTRNIEALTTNVRCNLFNTTETEIIVIGDGQTTGVLYLGTTPSIKGRTGNVVIGATTCNTESRGKIVANLGIQLPTASNFIDTNTSGATISLFDSLTTGSLNICKNITSGTVKLCNSIIVTPLTIASGATTDEVNLFNNINGTLGKINMASSFIISSFSIASTSVTDSISLFKNITTGSITMASNLVFKASTIASSSVNDTIDLFKNITTGSITMASNLVFKASTIASTVASNVIDLFKNITTGTINIGEGLTTGQLNIGTNQTTIGYGGTVNIGTGPKSNIIIGNSSTSGGNTQTGCCVIAKLALGYGTAIRALVIEFNIGAGLAGPQNYTMVSAPSVFGNPIIIAQMNASSTGTYIWSVAIKVTGPRTFEYNKMLQVGATTGGANSESFNFIAIWL